MPHLRIILLVRLQQVVRCILPHAQGSEGHACVAVSCMQAGLICISRDRQTFHHAQHHVCTSAVGAYIYRVGAATWGITDHAETVLRRGFLLLLHGFLLANIESIGGINLVPVHALNPKPVGRVHGLQITRHLQQATSPRSPHIAILCQGVQSTSSPGREACFSKIASCFALVSMSSAWVWIVVPALHTEYPIRKRSTHV